MNYINALIWSDLHLDSFKLQPSIPPQTDLIIIAGDTANKLFASNFLLQLTQHNKPIILVPGNHEYYSPTSSVTTIPQINQRLKSIHPLIHTLIDEEISLFNHSFFGSTLWTSINNNDPQITPLHKKINDFKHIHLHTKMKGYKQLPNPITTLEYITLHKQALYSIQQHLLTKKPTTIITHHSPLYYDHPYPNDPLNHFYYNNLEGLITHNPQITHWIHGHDHTRRYTLIGNTEVIANPRGDSKSEVQTWEQNYLIQIPISSR